MPFDTIRLGASAAGAYEIERSLRFNSADDTNLSRTFGTATNRKIWTYSGWFKRGERGTLFGSYADATTSWYSRFADNGQDRFDFTEYNGSSYVINLRPNQVLRDYGAWYHMVVAYDSTQGTAANRVKMYINGEQITSFSTETYPGQNVESGINKNQIHHIGRDPSTSSSSYYANGYMTEIHFVDGQQLAPTSFGETDVLTGQWIAKKYAGTYGNNGFYLNFSDNSNTTAGTLGADSSGNGNNFTPNNFSVSAGAGNDSFIDTPTNNFCTMNPLTKQNVTLTNGNLSISTDGNNSGVYATMTIPSTGKWYFELTQGSAGEPGLFFQTDATSMPRTFQWNATDHNGFFALMYSGLEVYDGTNLIDESGSPWNSYPNGTVYGFLFDRDNHTMKFRYNNGNEESCNEPTHTRGLPIEFGRSVTATWAAHNFTMNFGGNGFAYAIPDGYKTISTANLPDPTIKKGSDYFDILTYTGNETARTITGLSFDFNLLINSGYAGSASAATHKIVLDTVRGVAANKMLVTNTSGVEGVEDGATYGYLTSATGGFNLVEGSHGSSGWALMNYNGGYNFINWCWKESAVAGFDIVSYTGTGSATTISHSLGVKPEMIIVKNRDQADGWQVQHVGKGATFTQQMDGSGSFDDDDGPWNDTEPTSSVFSVKNDHKTNANNEKYIAYLFASVEGFSKFGTYQGNGSSNGPVIYTGFRPSLVISKRTDSSGYWRVLDDERSPDNPVYRALFLNATDAESTTSGSDQYNTDFLSNGFKLRTTLASSNASGGHWIYMAFAKSPFKYANAR